MTLLIFLIGINMGIQEILTYEIYKKNNNIYINIPVSGLIEPKYLIKENSLYIFLYNYTQGFILHNIDDKTIQYIVNKKAYLVESLSYDNQKEHLITLTNY